MNSIASQFNKRTASSSITGAALSVYQGGSQQDFTYGTLENHKPFFIASTTKLYTAALIFRLIDSGKLKLNTSVEKVLPSYALKGLHELNNHDFTSELMIHHLLAHTSGLPDYFQQKGTGGSLVEAIKNGNDQSWTFQDVIRWTCEMPGKFPPGQKGKAFYSDSNYQLLGKIIEELFEDQLDRVMERELFSPLGLTNTYLYSNPNDHSPQPIMYKDKALNIPKSMASFQADGGVVSTAPEMMTFIRAFMQNELFSVAIAELKQWNPIFFPLKSGIGLHRYQLPKLMTFFRQFPEIIGHSGLSGAFAWYLPEKDMYLSGTVNQIHDPGKSFQMVARIAMGS